MKSHDPKRISDAQARQYWRAFVYVMHLHENRCIKRAGVAGLRARAVMLRVCKRNSNVVASFARRGLKLYDEAKRDF